jgi:galactokinase
MRAWAPGRVNLIGDHTDYNDGLALPMAIDLGTTVAYTPDASEFLTLTSTGYPEPAEVPVDVGLDRELLSLLEPPWARLAAAVIAQTGPGQGGSVRVDTDLPVGAGLSSSAAFAVALALALGFEADPVMTARMVQRAEDAAGSSVGLMDPLVIAGGTQDHALLIDFATLRTHEVPVPARAEIVVVHSGVARELARSPYAARRAECEAAAIELGYPLGQAELADLAGILDPVMRRRTRHVVTECARVREMAEAFRRGDLTGAGALMAESHDSMAVDFEVSTPEIDQLVGALSRVDGVYGVRLTGGGFGGCVVALTGPGALDVDDLPGGRRGFVVKASGGATVEEIP